MISDFLIFPVFLCLLHLFGAGALRLAYGGKDLKQSGYPDWFYLAAGLFAVGFAAVMVNFFTGVASPVFYLALFLIAVIGVKQARLADFLPILVLGVILAPMAVMMPPGIDAGLYHLPQQLWLRDEKIVFGLSNFNTRFGFGSFTEYILAPLWMHEQFMLLSCAQAAFFVLLLLFLLRLAQSRHAAAAIAAALTFATLVINSKYFPIGFTSTDTPCGILFIIAFFYGFLLLHQDVPVEAKQLAIFFLCALFAFFSKATGAVIFFWGVFVIAMLLRNRRLAWNRLWPACILPFILMAVWLARGVIISGCLVYPVASTCINVPWAATKAATDNANAVTAWSRHGGAGLQPLHSGGWFLNWWLPHRWQFCLYEIITVAVVAGLYRFLCREKLALRHDYRAPAMLFIVGCLALWFIKSPTPRFGVGIFTVLPAVTAMSLFGFRRLPELKIRNLDRICRLLQPQAVLSTSGSLLAIVLAVKLVAVDILGKHRHVDMASAVKPNPYFGVKPLQSDDCWLVKYCSPDYASHDTMREKYGYYYFHE